MSASESTTLTPCAAVVAMAAPTAPMRKTPTSKRSPTTFTELAIATNSSGALELPSPRKIALARLYAAMNTPPAPQMRI